MAGNQGILVDYKPFSRGQVTFGDGVKGRVLGKKNSQHGRIFRGFWLRSSKFQFDSQELLWTNRGHRKALVRDKSLLSLWLLRYF